MFGKNYRVVNEEIWQGRIDSETNFDAFRWHQWVECVDLDREDLTPFTWKLGFALIGFCCDEGVKRNKGRAGAAKGPDSIREELANLPCCFNEEVKIFDMGNVYCEDITLEESQSLLSKCVDKILDLNLFPIVMGGGHETAFGNYSGVLNNIRKVEDKPKIGIINFDAHFDIRPYPNGGSSGTMFRQIADICNGENLPYSYFCIGVQKHSNTVELFKTAERLGVQYILAKDVLYSDNWSILEKLGEFIKHQDYIYVTICSDVFSSAFAPGVSAIQPLGLDPEKALIFLKYILRYNKVVSFDIAEVSPRFDSDNVTANLAASIIFTLINTLSRMNDCDIY
ncbi:formimidoylglutamase [uncultured Clostridium sp.]|uniref:formimidoylglutamase n=1 Tax=uncultured Clostridium sp. TaxID=59620 RepID=UPI0028E30936|nr:formimidoylglutamase [uncultured Clostridium sp.]